MVKNFEHVNLSVVSDHDANSNVQICKMNGKLDRVDSMNYVFNASPTKKSDPLPKLYVGSCITVAVDDKGGIRCYIKKFQPKDAVSFMDDMFVEMQAALVKIADYEKDGITLS